ncbi:TPM domain-containing protein [Pseudorhodoplanes sinuspersici]|uniref:Uncharacterized protein n=1 Tax=Pseudorhodoplanes sinuspersici TaxID=1235591 RepID=A0A1W6ZNY6_9HYPH|nr:TPM domain-containing protein [Pseudorhodoplanes sinuspersici]ARP99118.1 hypothetical protein CAK95_08495 [Pseudorhodoplanes sinuspersici]RKE69229.1 uncharacterized protein DFP91_3658 [Pseudorhodoplanes sinuspersici]
MTLPQATKFRALFLALAFAVITTAALAQSSLTFPALTGRVVDDAGILDANTRATLEKLSADLEAKSTDQLVVVTLKSLQGTSIEDYGYQLGRHWQIGQKGKDNGVLLIVAPNERKVRIEVGYGLEGTLTDLISNFIIRNSILPRFRAGDFQGGITRGAQDISQVLMGDADEYKQRAAQANAAQQQQIDPIDMIFIGFFVFMMIMTVLNALSNMRRGGRGIPAGGVRRTSNWAGAGPIILGSGWGGGDFGGGGWGGGGGFSGGGGSFGGGGSSGSW